MKPTRDSLRVKLFADGADIDGMVEMANKPYISGLTTNPTLMRKAGISNYGRFAKDVLNEIQTKPISFEVFSDDLSEMKFQGEQIASWGENVYVKIPITNTKGESTKLVTKYLSGKGIKVNITALMSNGQVEEVIEALDSNVESYVSVFAGRIADTGRNPIPIVQECLKTLSSKPKSELIWASPRELLNVIQADEIGCHIITATNDILNKINLIGKNLEEFSLETVAMFFKDGQIAGFEI